MQSYRDLPLPINQWANVVHWELRHRQNFAKAFNTSYPSKDGTQELVWQTPWGSATRMIGALVMMHGDDDGLRIPPRLARIQAVVLAVEGDDAVLAKVRESGGRLKWSASAFRSTTHRHPLRPSRGRLGTQGRARPHRGRPP